MTYNIGRPLPSELAYIWDCMRSETHLLGSSIQSLKDLIDPWGLTMLLFVGRVREGVAALFALYDVQYDASGNPLSAWAMLYVLPRFRGPAGLHLAQMALRQVEKWGFETLWASCLEDNTQARRFITRLGFEACGTLPHGNIVHYVWTLSASALAPPQKDTTHG